MHIIGFFCLCCHAGPKQAHATSQALCNTNQQRSKAPLRVQQRPCIVHGCTKPGNSCKVHGCKVMMMSMTMTLMMIMVILLMLLLIMMTTTTPTTTTTTTTTMLIMLMTVMTMLYQRRRQGCIRRSLRSARCGPQR